MQLSLLDQMPSGPDASFRSLRRLELGQRAWLDYAPEWFSGHGRLFDLLLATCEWEKHRRAMYDRIVEVPRLVASAPGSGRNFDFNHGDVVKFPRRAGAAQVSEAVDSLAELGAILSVRYRRALTSVTLGYYRSGEDSVAYHGDKMGTLRSDTVVALLSVGSRRKFLLRPAAGGPSRAFQCGEGDLLVMGGTCQQTFQHAVPKAKSNEPRIVVMFREKIPQPRAVQLDLGRTRGIVA